MPTAQAINTIFFGWRISYPAIVILLGLNVPQDVIEIKGRSD
jgi:uncharacterized integral membrane protein